MDQPSQPKPPPLDYESPPPGARGPRWWIMIGAAVVLFIFFVTGTLYMRALAARQREMAAMAQAQAAKAQVLAAKAQAKAAQQQARSALSQSGTAQRALEAAVMQHSANSGCAQNLRALDRALRVYAGEHDGQLPDSLKTLLSAPNIQLAPAELICRATRDTPATGATREEISLQITSQGSPDAFADPTTRPALHLSYMYCGGGSIAGVSPSFVRAYEPISNHGSGGGWFLFADGRVEFLAAEHAQKFIDEIQSGHNPPRAEMMK